MNQGAASRILANVHAHFPIANVQIAVFRALREICAANHDYVNLVWATTVPRRPMMSSRLGGGELTSYVSSQVAGSTGAIPLFGYVRSVMQHHYANNDVQIAALRLFSVLANESTIVSSFLANDDMLRYVLHILNEQSKDPLLQIAGHQFLHILAFHSDASGYQTLRQKVDDVNYIDRCIDATREHPKNTVLVGTCFYVMSLMMSYHIPKTEQVAAQFTSEAKVIAQTVSVRGCDEVAGKMIEAYPDDFWLQTSCFLILVWLGKHGKFANLSPDKKARLDQMTAQALQHANEYGMKGLAECCKELHRDLTGACVIL